MKPNLLRILLRSSSLFLLSLVITSQVLVQSRSGDNFTVTPVAAEEVPTHGTFWSLQRTNMPPWPLYPPFLRELDAPVYLLDAGRGVLLVDDSQIDYEAIYQQREEGQVLRKLEYEAGLMSAQEYWALEGGAPAAARGDYPADALWLEITGVSNQLIYVTVHGTIPDTTYEILGRESLLEGAWAGELPLVLGASGQDWTAAAVAVGTRTNLFLWARSWVDDDGDGLPTWWELEHGLDPNNPDTGDTGVPDGYKDGDHDGWTNMQEYQNGTKPNQFNTPAAPAGLVVQTDATGTHARLTWLPANGPVTGYTIQRGSDNSLISVGGASVSHVDAATSLPTGWYYNYQLPSYRIRTEYAGGSSAWTDWQNVAELHSPVAQVISGADNGGRIVVAEIPAAAAYVRVGGVDGNGLGNYLTNAVDIPVSQFTNGMAVLPATYMQAAAGRGWAARFILTNATAGAIRDDWYDTYAVAPFWDGRAQLKDNLRFQLRIPSLYNDFSYWQWPASYYQGLFVEPFNYAYSGYHDIQVFSDIWQQESIYQFLEPLVPFEENYRFRNFVFSSTNLNTSGRLTTGIDNDARAFATPYNPTFVFSAPPAPTTIASLLTTDQTQWLPLVGAYAYTILNNIIDGEGNEDLGVTSTEISPGESYLFSMTDIARNWFGLPNESYLIVWSNTPPSIAVMSPGQDVIIPAGKAGYIYPSPAQPVFQTDSYYFTRVYNEWQEVDPPLPGYPYFNPTNTTPALFITSVGAMDFKLAGYAKLAVLNGYAGVYGYLGQYFDKAFTTTNGVVTTNETGILSPYGEFFPTERGRTALVTLPDIETGERGTAIVHVVSLNVDANHDGVMDLSFAGPDNTSQSKPFTFWVNNDRDMIKDIDDWGQDGQVLQSYLYDYRFPTINSVRDLEDFARIWICGMPVLATNAGYQVTLSWNVGSGSPAINLVRAVEADGGTGYLTETNTAWNQIESVSPTGPGWKLGTVAPGQPFTFPDNYFTNSGDKYFLFEGAGIGSGTLVLTIAQGPNVLAQTSVFMDLHDVKDFFEHSRSSDVVLTGPPTTNTGAFHIDNIQAVSDSAEEHQIIIFVHGINNSWFDYENTSQTMFKRLYWQGYRGRFVAFRWESPTWSLIPTSESQISYLNFNKGEYIAYQSAGGLKACIDDLRNRFPGYTLNLMTHSLGAAVGNQAIRLGAQVDNYAMCQGAMSAWAFDGSNTNLIYSHLASGAGGTPDADALGGYRNAFTDATRRVNFYNEDDWALFSGPLGIWEGNQRLSRPDTWAYLGGFTARYSFDGTNCFYREVDTEGHLLTDRTLTQDYEKKAYVARSRTKAVGAAGLVNEPHALTQGVVTNNISLQDASLGFVGGAAFGNTRPEHSGQFTKSIQNAVPFYRALLNDGFLIRQNP